MKDSPCKFSSHEKVNAQVQPLCPFLPATAAAVRRKCTPLKSQNGIYICTLAQLHLLTVYVQSHIHTDKYTSAHTWTHTHTHHTHTHTHTHTPHTHACMHTPTHTHTHTHTHPLTRLITHSHSLHGNHTNNQVQSVMHVSQTKYHCASPQSILTMTFYNHLASEAQQFISREHWAWSTKPLRTQDKVWRCLAHSHHRQRSLTSLIITTDK